MLGFTRVIELASKFGLLTLLQRIWVKIRRVLGSSYRRSRLNLYQNITIGEGTEIRSTAKIDNWGRVEIGKSCRIDEYARIRPQDGYISIGDNCSVNHFSMLNGAGGLSIGDDVRIAAHTVIVAANHIYDSREVAIRNQGATKEGIKIEDDVWIGSNVTVLDGVTIGKGSVIAAGAVVTESVPEYSVVGGVPAKRISNR